MDKVIIRYGNNKSMRYNGKDFLESVSKVCGENETGRLQISESVTINSKSLLWKPVVVNLQPTQLKRGKSRHTVWFNSEIKRSKKSLWTDTMQDTNASTFLASFTTAAPSSQSLAIATSTSHSALAPSPLLGPWQQSCIITVTWSTVTWFVVSNTLKTPFCLSFSQHWQLNCM